LCAKQITGKEATDQGPLFFASGRSRRGLSLQIIISITSVVEGLVGWQQAASYCAPLNSSGLSLACQWVSWLEHAIPWRRPVADNTTTKRGTASRCWVKRGDRGGQGRSCRLLGVSWSNNTSLSGRIRRLGPAQPAPDILEPPNKPQLNQSRKAPRTVARSYPNKSSSMENPY
jgi:hypothetical protein